MSHQVRIDYNAIGLKCESVCELAEKELAAFKKEATKLLGQSKSLQNERTKRFAKLIEEETAAFSAKADALLAKARQMIGKGVAYADGDRNKFTGDIESATSKLLEQVNAMSSSRLIELDGLLQSLLKIELGNNEKALENGESEDEGRIKELLEGIENEALRQYTYLAHLQDHSLWGNELLEAGKRLLGKTFESRLEEEKSKIRAELESARVDGAAVDRIVEGGNGNALERLSAIREAANEEIVSEKVRQKSLKIIIKAIQARGFIVDNRNIRLMRESNEVRLVALKASGEKAEFRVFLNGKFIYDFRGYQGMACQNDIEPFMRDLEEVYGMIVTSQQTIWSNPDKISSMKMQTMGVNKNRG